MYFDRVFSHMTLWHIAYHRIILTTPKKYNIPNIHNKVKVLEKELFLDMIDQLLYDKFFEK